MRSGWKPQKPVNKVFAFHSDLYCTESIISDSVDLAVLGLRLDSMILKGLFQPKRFYESKRHQCSFLKKNILCLCR